MPFLLYAGVIFSILLPAPTALSDVPHVFENGQTADATKINENFTSLDDRLDAVEALAPDPSSLNPYFGFFEMAVDCSEDSAALQNIWGQLLGMGSVSVTLTGNCIEPTDQTAGLSGQTVMLSGSSCESKPILLDNDGFGVTLYLNLGATLWLRCLQLGESEPAQLVGFHGNQLRLDNVSAGSGTLNVELRNNSTLRVLQESQISFLKLRSGSTAEFQNFGNFPLNLDEVRLLDGSKLISRYPPASSIGNLTLSNGSSVSLIALQGTVTVDTVTARGRSFIFASDDSPPVVDAGLVVTTQNLSEGSEIFLNLPFNDY